MTESLKFQVAQKFRNKFFGPKSKKKRFSPSGLCLRATKYRNERQPLYFIVARGLALSSYLHAVNRELTSVLIIVNYSS